MIWMLNKKINNINPTNHSKKPTLTMKKNLFKVKQIGLSGLLIIGASSLLTSCVETPIKPTSNHKPIKNSDLSNSEQTKKSAHLELAIKALQTGQVSIAQAEIKSVLKLEPNNKIAQSLKDQIEIDSNQYFEDTFRDYKIQKGDSLGALALKYLGSDLEFYALAKYNRIDNPSLLNINQLIKIPYKKLVPTHLDNISPASDSPWLVQEKKALAYEENGEIQSANQIWIQLMNHDAFREKATQHLNANKDFLTNQKMQLEMRTNYQNGEWDKLQQLVKTTQPIQTEKGFDPAEINTFIRALTKHYHKMALSLYRQQKLQPAIDLWDKLLEINQDNEPAKVYQERAVALLKKLKEY